MMKIAIRMFRHPKSSVGGAERQMELIGRELLKRNVDFHYIANKLYNYQKKFEIINGIKVHFIGLRKFRSNLNFKQRILSLINSFDILLFFKYFYKFNFDIYHLRVATDITGFWAFFAKIIKRKKFVFTTSHIRNCIPGSYQWSKFNYRTYEYAIKRADVIITLANYMRKALYQNYGVRSVVIKSGHPIPTGPFKKDDPPLILWIARLANWKRPELFIEIARQLKNLKVNFLIIGVGNLNYEILAFAKKNENFSYIPGFGVPVGKDNAYYEKASILVNTSDMEGYPNSFIQAWMCETPVMSLDVDPDCDICKNGLGYHAKGDLKKLINEIKKLIENPSELEAMGRRCRNYAIKNHNIEKTAEQHYKLYKWIINK